MRDMWGTANVNGPTWFGGNIGGDIVTTPVSSQAGNLVADSTCYEGKCALCLRFQANGKLYGAGAPCPLGNGLSHIAMFNNPQSCKAFEFHEIACPPDRTA